VDSNRANRRKAIEALGAVPIIASIGTGLRCANSTLMSARRFLTLAAVGCFFLGSVSAQTADRNFLKVPLLHEEDGAIREVGYVPLSDGTQLSYVAYYPAAHKRVPVIIEYSPYGRGGRKWEAQWHPASPKDFLAHGYAYVGVDIRGTTCSTGTFSMFDPQIGADGAQMIEYIGSRPWSNGSVGLWGVSYPGQSQIFTAAKHPRFLKALAAGGLTADIYAEAWRPGGMFASAFIAHWGVATRNLGIAMADDTGAHNRHSWGDAGCDAEKAKLSFWNAYGEVKSHPLDDEWWKPRLVETYIGQVQVPTLIFGGWQDFETKSSGAIYLYEHLHAKDKRLILQPGGHDVAYRQHSQIEMYRWYDRWLKNSGRQDQPEEPVKVFWDVRPENGVQTAVSPATSYPAWPVPQATPMTLYLTPSGELTPEKPLGPDSDGGRMYVAPIGTEMVGSNEQFALSPDPLGSLTYQTAPLQSDVTLLGYTQFDMYFSSDQPDTSVMIVLHDIDEQGNVTFIQREYLQASLRKLDSVLSTTEERKRCFCEREMLEPGKVYEAQLSIPPVGYVLHKGHRLELGIMTPSQIGSPEWGFVLVDEGGFNTIHSSASYPSRLILSTIKTPDSVLPAAPCGVIEWQPCRKAEVQ
jgi:uncharacterized protein